MARYEPLPYVREPRRRDLRLADLYLRQGEQQADAERRSGEIRANLWGGIGQAVGQTATAMIEAPNKKREQDRLDAESAQRRELGDLQLGEARRSVNDRENFDLAMSAGSRQKTLEALKDRPELYEKAQSHFTKIDTTMKQLLGDTAAGIADFGYTPEAAMAAMDDLLDQGFDERKIAPFRQAIQQNPESVKQIVDSLLNQSPDPRHQAMAKPKPLVELNKDTSLYDPNKGEVIAEGPKSPPPQKSLQAKEVLLDGRPVMATFDPVSGGFTVNGKDVTARVRPVPPQGPAGGEPLEAVIGPDGNPQLVPRSQARGMRPATSREQPTEDERKTAGFYQRMNDAIRVMDEVEGKLSEKDLYQIQTLPQEALMGMLNRGQMTNEAKRYVRAMMQFTEARLRADSGAAINKDEYVSDRQMYARQYSETPELNADRRSARQIALDGLKTRGGRAVPKVDTNAAQPGDIEYDMNGKPIKKGGQ